MQAKLEVLQAFNQSYLFYTSLRDLAWFIFTTFPIGDRMNEKSSRRFGTANFNPGLDASDKRDRDLNFLQ